MPSRNAPPETFFDWDDDHLPYAQREANRRADLAFRAAQPIYADRILACDVVEGLPKPRDAEHRAQLLKDAEERAQRSR